MNLLGFVFSLLIILGISLSALFHKHFADTTVRSTYVGHLKANRKILSSFETELYRSLSCAPKKPFAGAIPQSSFEEDLPEDSPEEEETAETPSFPKCNPPSSKLSLWPLISEGKEAHPLLYETLVHLLTHFYGETFFPDQKHFAGPFLDVVLEAARQRLQNQVSLSLEKLSLADPHLQKIYYQMLKGIKNCNLFEKRGYPSLGDYLSLDLSAPPVCLFDAHPHLLSVFFGPKVALKLYAEVHKKNGPLCTQELVEHLCSEAHFFIPNKEIFSLFQWGRPHRKKGGMKTFIEEDEISQVSLRKSFFVNSSQKLS